MKIDLRKIREDNAPRDPNTGRPKAISRDDLSAMLSEKVGRKMYPTQIARYEEDPGTVPLELLIPWLQCLGTTLEEQLLALSREPDQVIDAGDPYAPLRTRLTTVRAYAENARAEGLFDAADDELSKLATTGLEELCKTLDRKPNIVLSGAFDAGKTALANWLLSTRSLPERYQPATAVVTYVRHLTDRPAGLEDTVYLLNGRFDPNQWMDGGSVAECTVAAGDLDCLRERGVHGSEKRESEAESALVFLDSPILRSCNIVDHPGFHNDDSDTKRAEKAFANVDILIYASTFSGFMNGPDITILREFLRRLPVYENVAPAFPTLGNLFIVATHAGPQIGEEQIPQTLEIAADRIWREIGATEMASRSGISRRQIDSDVIRSRLFTFWRENRQRTERLSRNVVELLANSLPSCIEAIADNKMLTFRESLEERLVAAIGAYRHTLGDVDMARREYEEKMEHETARRELLEGIRQRLTATIEKGKSRHIQEFFRLYDERMNLERLEDTIRTRYGDKKEAQQHVASHIISGIQHDAWASVQGEADKVAALVEEYVATYDASVTINIGAETISLPFDSRSSFIGGFANLESIGALAIWAGSYLGSYVVAVEAASILSGLGIGLSGSAAAATSIGVFGSPVAFVLVIAAAVYFVFRALFGESWQTKLAKQVFDYAKKKKVKESIVQDIRDYWDNSLAAFNNGAERIEADYAAQLCRYGDIVNKNEVEKVKQILHRFEQHKVFIDRLPWVSKLMKLPASSKSSLSTSATV
jgi:hypothetical protein